jgi:hypothetical protein
VQGGGEDRQRRAQARRAHGRARRARGGVPRPLPHTAAPGIGPRAEERLLADGIDTIGALSALPEAEVRRLLPGKVGALLHDRARGIDPRPLETSSETISISHEETFDQDVADRGQLKAELRRMADSLSRHLADSGLFARTITTKLRYQDFSIRSRSTTLPAATDDADRIGDLAAENLDRALDERPGALRLVGVAVSGLQAHRQLEWSRYERGPIWAPFQSLPLRGWCPSSASPTGAASECPWDVQLQLHDLVGGDDSDERPNLLGVAQVADGQVRVASRPVSLTLSTLPLRRARVTR